MSNDMPPNRLPTIGTGKGHGAWVGLNMVGLVRASIQSPSKMTTTHANHKNKNIKLLCNHSKKSKMPAKKLLALTNLAPSRIVNSEFCHNGVDDDDAEVARGELLDQVEDYFVLVLGVDDTDVDYVVVGEVLVDCDASIVLWWEGYQTYFRSVLRCLEYYRDQHVVRQVLQAGTLTAQDGKCSPCLLKHQ